MLTLFIATEKNLGSSSQSQSSSEKGPSLRGRIQTQLLNQMMIMAFTNRSQVKTILNELNEELEPVDLNGQS